MAGTLNMGTVKTPGVYIDEMSLFPPSVAQVDTAVPAFIGPTRLEYKTLEPVRIGSMAEFRSYYGGGPDRSIVVKVDARNAVQSVSAKQTYCLFDSLQMYFANGGEKCYVVSTGVYGDGDSDSNGDGYTDSASVTTDVFTKALEALERFDEPTLIVIPDAVSMAPAAARDTQQAMLTHCHKMQDRFAILDVQMDSLDDVDAQYTAGEFRKGANLYPNYGAAYFPYLRTSLPLTVDYAGLQIKQGTTTLDLAKVNPEATTVIKSLTDIAAERKTVRGMLPDSAAYVGSGTTGQARAGHLKGKLATFLTGGSATDASDAYQSYATSDAADYLADQLDTAAASAGTKMPAADKLYDEVTSFINGFVALLDSQLQAGEAELKRKSPVYAGIVASVAAEGIVLPPSGAVAGAYARTDADRGVWKSPANVALNYVNGPVVSLTDAEQDGLNVDPESGKSINAIRAFSGKGTLVWGARTLAGSDNEWRYVSVRRFFIMAEESIKKATAQFVFEANDANTWVRVRAMIENFLTLQWRAGALAGAKADNAFFVRVGLGQTMTPQDVLNGFMIIEIGLAVVRPAEFIVLRFSHKMQQA